MPRPKAYDEKDVLNAAMRVFWRKGYVGTSMADIYAATGLKPGNLYATFSDKETLFQRAFEVYAQYFRDSMPKGVSGKVAIDAWIDTQARLAMEDEERKGCLIVNTVTERDAHSPKTQGMAAARLNEITQFFRDELETARRNGEVAASSNIGRMAAALTGSVVAIMSLGRGGADASVIRHIAEAAKSAVV